MRQLDDWVEAYMHLTRNSEPADLFRRWSALSTLASALQRKCYMNWGPMTFYPNMYVVLIAPPGMRKGTAMEPAQDFLESIPGVKLAAEAITREALIRELKTSTDTVIDLKTGSMEFHSSLTVHSREFTVFIGYQNHQLMSDLADWYDCRKRWTYRTKNQGTDELIGVWVNIIGATTPELLKLAMPIDMIGSGLASRIIFIYETTCKISPTPWYTKDDLKLRDVMVTDLANIATLQGQFTLTEDFIEFWVNWYTEYRNNPLPFDDLKFSGYFQRRPIHALKLAMILNVSRCDNMIITSEDLQAGINLLIQTEKNMKNTFAGVGSYSLAAVTTSVMNYVGMKKLVSYQELMMGFKDELDARMLDNVLATLERAGCTRTVKNTGMIEWAK